MRNASQLAERADHAARNEKIEGPDAIQKTMAVRHPRGTRIAYCKVDAGIGNTIACYLDEYKTGREVVVHCKSIINTSNLNAAVPRLVVGLPIGVSFVNGQWQCFQIFQKSVEC
ncbi:MAG: hypothetical protein DRP65_11605 [Planctomycetota bacterium]|nr:MAG: hypothetical protein DRP65_11605 [Planctomycetota bacterium]